MKITFLGANRQVTGSRYLVEAGGLRLLVDCGMFQERPYVKRNWAPSPIRPDQLDAVLLTHAHLDHSGLLPRLVREGFKGPVYTTAASRDLAEIILMDAAKIQVEDARYKQKRHDREGRTGRHPVDPLYEPDDARATMKRFSPVLYGEPLRLGDDVSVTYHDAGHILGSAMLEIVVGQGEGARTLVFSGDVGQWDKPIIRDPTELSRADYVVMESTYGGRNHRDSGPVEDQLCDIINETVSSGGNVVIPTFAVERAQELMYHIGQLLREDRIPNLLVFLDSPMAVNATEVFRRHKGIMDEEAEALLEEGEPVLMFEGMNLIRSTRDSKAINRIRGSCIILASSGMCTAGRIKHHLVANIARPESSVVITGYQAHGTLGREIADGRDKVRIHGAERTVKARIHQLHGLSAHADHADLLRWLGNFDKTPRRVFLTHGEEDAAEALAKAIRSELKLDVAVPEYEEQVELG